MNLQINVPAGTRPYIGQPTRPDRNLSRSIARLLSSFPEVREAHFPQCFAPNLMSKPAQVLMVVLDQSDVASDVVVRINERLVPLLSDNAHIDLWPIRASDPWLESIRGVGCRIFARTSSGKATIENPWSLSNKLFRRFRGR
jgi:SseB protein C-terminal domain